MRRKFASWLRRLADRLAPAPATGPVDVLMPIARHVVASVDKTDQKSAMKWVMALKSMRRLTGAKDRHINAAIDRAVLELRGD